jgi:hypothetical protein
VLEGLLADVLAEAAVGLELALVEELVGGRLVGEGGLAVTVLPDHLVLVSGDRRLEVEEVAGLALAGVVDAPHRPVPRAEAALVEPQRVDVDVDVDSEVDAGGANPDLLT